MVKEFSYEKRVASVKLYYESHLSTIRIAKIFGVDPSVIQNWIKRYEYNGLPGLQVRRTHTKYPEEFKQKILEKLKEGKSATYLTQKYMLSPSTIIAWRIEYEQGGKIMQENTVISREESEALRKKYKHTKDPELKELIERLEWVEMENEALKKLEALTREERQRQK